MALRQPHVVANTPLRQAPRRQHTPRMYLRRARKSVAGVTSEYWSLVEARRTAHGPRQVTVAALGQWPGLDAQVRAGWEPLDELLDGQPRATPLSLPDGTMPDATVPAPEPPDWRTVDVHGVRVERAREFGAVYLALALWRRLGLHTLLRELLPAGRADLPWEAVLCALTSARFDAQPSEWGVAERWYQRTALEDLLGLPWAQINDDRLSRALAAVHGHQEPLGQHLLARYQSWFGVGFEFLIYPESFRDDQHVL